MTDARAEIMQDRILIVDDEIDLLRGLQRMLADGIDCQVLISDNGREAVDIIRQQSPDLVLADIIMPELDGMDLLRAALKIDPSSTVILMTAYGTIELAVQAIKEGAYDFIAKPFDEDQMLHKIQKGLERSRLVRENAKLLRQLSDQSPFQRMIGRSDKMQKIFDRLRALARTDVTVLIMGESGTGKELAARAIHELSPRGHLGMVTVNCPAIPENILESELFGYCRGAFTNAAADKKGLFEEADGSTIFLDEIGDLSLSLQTKLLRVLQEKEIRRLGDNRTRRVDVRIIASTNQDLPRKMQENQFREDLYYRLKVAALEMPPLREIREDIPLLIQHFLEKAAAEFDIEPRKMTPEALACLYERNWPGNVRELENTIRGICATAPGKIIDRDMLPFLEAPGGLLDGAVNFCGPYKSLKNEILGTFTIQYINDLLSRTGGNISRAAQLSGIKRQSLQKIIKRYQIAVDKFRT